MYKLLTEARKVCLEYLEIIRIQYIFVKNKSLSLMVFSALLMGNNVKPIYVILLHITKKKYI